VQTSASVHRCCGDIEVAREVPAGGRGRSVPAVELAAQWQEFRQRRFAGELAGLFERGFQSWDGVVQRLQRDGYTVDVPPNPLQGLAYDPAYLADFLHTISGPIILVGHSYGGAVITNAATGDAQVKALVYVDAFAPAQGQTIGQLVSAVPGSCVVAADPTTIFNLATFPGAPAGVFDAYVKQSLFPSCFANGLPANEARMLAATQEPLSTIALSQKSGVPAWKTIPSWAVVGTADHVILPAEQLAMARQAHAHITEVRAPHLSMISDPGVVTQVIVEAAQATG